MHPICILKAFGYKEKKLSANNNLQKYAFQDHKSVFFWGGGHCLLQWDQGGSPPDTTYHTRALIRRPPPAIDPAPSCFWIIRTLKITTVTITRRLKFSAFHFSGQNRVTRLLRYFHFSVECGFNKLNFSLSPYQDLGATNLGRTVKNNHQKANLTNLRSGGTRVKR